MPLSNLTKERGSGGRRQRSSRNGAMGVGKEKKVRAEVARGNRSL